jgi:hypothetical protein
MSFGPLTDVAISLIFTYLLLALLASGIQEFIAGALQWRGKHLRDAVRDMLALPAADGKVNAALFDKVWGHPLISLPVMDRLPSYLPSRNFALAVLDALGGSAPEMLSQVGQRIAALPDSRIKTTVTSLLQDAGGDADKLKLALATWYDDTMDRVAGVYKRFSQYCLVAVGLVLAVGLNVDTLRVADTLWRDPLLRAAMVSQAQAFNTQHGSDATTAPTSNPAVVASVDALPIPMGWSGTGDQFAPAHFIWALLGWLATAIATSLGAPFWFDALGTAMKLRSAGIKPDRADA